MLVYQRAFHPADIYIYEILPVWGNWNDPNINQDFEGLGSHKNQLVLNKLHGDRTYLVGGLEHFLFFHILGIMIPTDFHIFQRGRSTSNQFWMNVWTRLVPGIPQSDSWGPRFSDLFFFFKVKPWRLSLVISWEYHGIWWLIIWHFQQFLGQSTGWLMDD